MSTRKMDNANCKNIKLEWLNLLMYRIITQQWPETLTSNNRHS